MRIDEDDPMWDAHSGGSGHDGPEWRPGDEDRALVYTYALDRKARDVLGYLVERPNQGVHCGELVDELGLDPGGAKRPANVLAGSLYSMGVANKVTGRRFPYRWWMSENGAFYGVQGRVARIFDKKRSPYECAVPVAQVSGILERGTDECVCAVRCLAGEIGTGTVFTTAVSASGEVIEIEFRTAETWLYGRTDIGLDLGLTGKLHLAGRGASTLGDGSMLVAW